MRLFLSFGKRLSDQPRGDLFEHNKQINKDLDGNCFLFVKGLNLDPAVLFKVGTGLPWSRNRPQDSGESVYVKKSA